MELAKHTYTEIASVFFTGKKRHKATAKKDFASTLPHHETVRLGVRDIGSMLRLQAKAASPYIVPKTAADLTKHFEKGNSAVGIVRNGKLIAQATIKNEHRANGAMLSGAFATCAERAKNVQIGVIGFLMIDPACRGQGLGDTIIDQALADMGYNGFDYAEARVKLDNTSAAWSRFMKHGFAITAIGASPDQPDKQVYSLMKPLGRGLALSGDLVQNFKASETNAIRQSLSQHMVATDYKRENDTFRLQSCAAL